MLAHHLFGYTWLMCSDRDVSPELFEQLPLWARELIYELLEYDDEDMDIMDQRVVARLHYMSND